MSNLQVALAHGCGPFRHTSILPSRHVAVNDASVRLAAPSTVPVHPSTRPPVPATPPSGGCSRCSHSFLRCLTCRCFRLPAVLICLHMVNVGCLVVLLDPSLSSHHHTKSKPSDSTVVMNRWHCHMFGSRQHQTMAVAAIIHSFIHCFAASHVTSFVPIGKHDWKLDTNTSACEQHGKQVAPHTDTWVILLRANDSRWRSLVFRLSKSSSFISPTSKNLN